MRHLPTLAALVLASAAGAQQVPPVYSYPSPGTTPQVQLQCTYSAGYYINCLPITPTNPLPVAVVSGGGGGGATTISDGADTAEGATSNSAYTDSTGSAAGTVVAIGKGIFANTSGLFKSGQLIGNTGFNVTNFPATQAVSGTVTANLGSLNGAATAASQSTQITAEQAIQAAQTNGSQVAQVFAKGTATLATGQVSVGTTATLIRAADTGRTSITVIIGAANSCAFGNSGVTLTTGYLLPANAGANDTTPTSAALYGVCSATTTISYKAILP